MALLLIERTGGLAGFGGPGAHLRSRGQKEWATLSAADQETVDTLFRHPIAEAGQLRDGFRYRITHTTAAGTRTIEVPDHAVPAALIACVKDELV